MREAVARAADRLAAVRALGRTWEDAPYLVGLLLLADDRERLTPGSGRVWIDRVSAVVGDGTAPVANGDFAGYAQAAMDLYRIASPSDTSRRARLLAATDGPLALRGPGAPRHAVGRSPGRTLVAGGRLRDPLLGGRSLHAAARTRDARLRARVAPRRPAGARPRVRMDRVLPVRPPAAGDDGRGVPRRALAAAAFRAPPLEPRPLPLPSRHRLRMGELLGRGNGWAAWGLSRSAGVLDAPYGGGRYDEAVDRTGDPRSARETRGRPRRPAPGRRRVADGSASSGGVRGERDLRDRAPHVRAREGRERGLAGPRDLHAGRPEVLCLPPRPDRRSGRPRGHPAARDRARLRGDARRTILRSTCPTASGRSSSPRPRS